MPQVQSVRPLDAYRLAVCFDDGTTGEVDLKDRLFGPVFEPLKDPQFFAKAFVDEFGAVAWPNGADLAPDAMYEQLRDSARTAAMRGYAVGQDMLQTVVDVGAVD